MINRMTQSLDFQAQALSLRSERQRMISSNIANADTPGYTARDMDFAQVLRDATGGLPAAAQLGTPQPGHLPNLVSQSGEARLRYALAAQTNLDGNSVDMDRERASFAENSVKYEATLRFLNGDVRTMLDAMKSAAQG